MRTKRKSKFQQRLEEVQKKHNEETGDQDSPGRSSQTAQQPDDGVKVSKSHTAQPPNPHGDLNWRHITEELPQYYSPIHIWDGKILHKNWTRVWSETVSDVYVNNQDDSVIRKITHWTPPEGQVYPKYEPLNDDDVKRYTRRDIKYILKAAYKLIKRREGSNLPHIEYNAGVDDAIILLERLIKPKRMTDKKHGG